MCQCSIESAPAPDSHLARAATLPIQRQRFLTGTGPLSAQRISDWPKLAVEMHSRHEIEHEVERLYVVFRRYGRKEHMESCPCCRGPEKVRPLYNCPLRQLTPEDLHLYAFSAMTTMGDVEDFRYFLPRLLELLNDEDFLASVDREILLSKLRYGDWETWPEDEQDAVREYLGVLWRLKLRMPPPANAYETSPISDWLCALARAERDLAPYLRAWDAELSPAANANLSRFVAEHRDEIYTCRVPAGYWEDAADQWRQVAQWVTSKDSKGSL